jgi:hypothetical protein
MTRGKLRSLFNKKLKEWNKENKKERWYLFMKILNWGSKLPLSNNINFWDIVGNQIRVKAEKMGITSENVVEYLFDQKNSEEWISRFK